MEITARKVPTFAAIVVTVRFANSCVTNVTMHVANAQKYAMTAVIVQIAVVRIQKMQVASMTSVY